MKINKWIGKLNIKFELRWKKHYKHSYPWLMKRVTKDSMKYGTGIMQFKWDVKRPWEFWKAK